MHYQNVFLRLVEVFGILQGIVFPKTQPDPSKFIQNGDVIDIYNNSQKGRQRSLETTTELTFPFPPLSDYHYLPDPLVELKGLGKLLGYFLMVANGRKVYAFEGIPYAEPPVNNLRFRDPVPKRPWHSVLPARSWPNLCVQTRAINPGIHGVEDCLYLNVYSPKIFQRNDTTPQKFPVIVFIHGGANSVGSSFEYGPSYMLIQDVVLVTINYRLGLFGFLNTGTCGASGNWGHRDQALALEWVRSHIDRFSGDPDNITVMGQSSGAVGAHLLMMSPSSRLKVKRGILMSGSAFSFWAVTNPPINPSKSNARVLARYTLCGYKNEQAMLKCLRSRHTDILALAANLILVREGVIFRTIVEPFCADGNFILKTPTQYYEDNEVAKVPIIASMTSQELEFNLVLKTAGIREEDWFHSFSTPFLITLLPDLLEYRNKVRSSLAVTLKILKHYHDFPQNLKRIADIATDRAMALGLRKLIDTHSQVAPTFALLFNYTSHIGFAEQLRLAPQNFGVPHGEDLLFLFNRTYFKAIPPSYDNLDFWVASFLESVFVNFASQGIPEYSGPLPESREVWKPVNERNKNEIVQFLQITRNGEALMTPMKEFQKTTDFWLSLGIADV